MEFTVRQKQRNMSHKCVAVIKTNYRSQILNMVKNPYQINVKIFRVKFGQ